MTRIELDETALPTSTEARASQSVTATATPRAIAAAEDPPPAELAPGRRLAHFKIDRLLGAGGMGQVYLATDLALDRPVALKVLPPAVAHDPGRRQRLIREARAQARINHPNVCHIYFIGEEDGFLFFAMEYVDGESVADLVGKGALPLDRALAIVRMAAEGLREADRAGFTHRDVKPSNLMIDRAGRVKVVDFGLVTDAPRAAAAGSDDVAATGIAGTPLYMAPEQARGDAVDRRADVYALGATLYHLVAGAPPFAAQTAGELLALHSTADRPTLPRRGRGREVRRLPVLSELCARMMAADPEARFESYDDLIAELERVTPAVTRPAGIVARGAAALLDLLVLVPFAIGLELLPYQLTVDNNVVWLPAMWLYATLATWRYGRTLGKALLDLEIVPIVGPRRIRFGRAAIRSAFYIAPLFVGIGLRELGEELATTAPGAAPWIAATGKVVAILACIWPIAALAWTSWRRPDKRAPWDRVTGTMVRYVRAA